MRRLTKTAGFIIAAVAAVAVIGFAMYSRHRAPNMLTIDTRSGNYELFIDNEDNEYFSTKDANVKNIIKTYLTKQKEYPYGLTDAQNYGSTLVYYYTRDVFIAAGVGDWRDRNSPLGFSLYNMKTGQQISSCVIYSQAGFYKNNDLLLSVSYIDNGTVMKYGACLYQRRSANFTFIDLTSKLGANETLFNDPAGRSLKATIKDVDTQKKTFVVDVNDMTKKDADGNYVYKRSIKVSY